ncbi:MAG: S9 family peptidase [Proteobacteria bacterium]|nr:S9 family peptidase [Pseudomonadota bacterium]
MSFITVSRILLSLLAVSVLQACSYPEGDTNSVAPPDTIRQDIADDFFGHEVSDPYRWLEDLESEKTIRWAKAQDAFARQFLETDSDLLEIIKEKIAADANADNMALPLRRGDILYFILVSPEFVNPALVKKDLATGVTEVVVDPGADYVIHDFRPDEAGNILAYALQHKETGERTWYFRNMGSDEQTGTELSGGAINGNPWARGGETFIYYTPPDRQEGRPASILSVELNGNGDTVVLFENTDAPGARTYPDVTDNGRFLVISIFEKSNANRVLVKPLEGADNLSVELFQAREGLHTYVGSDGDTLYFMTTNGSPKGRLVSFDLGGDEALAETTLVGEQEDALTQAYFFGNRFLGVYMESGFQIIIIFSLSGNHIATLYPPKGLVWNDFPLNWPPFSGGKGPKAYFRSIALMDAGVFEIDMDQGTMTQIASRGRPGEAGKYTIRQVFYKSHDSTQVPMTVIHRADLDLDGNTPLLMNVYGAYGFTFIPFFNPMYRQFIESGGIYAVPNIRGGGIYGQEWYNGGRSDNKINSALDTVFAAKWLLENNYTTPSRLAITGNSAGTIPAAVAAISNPELFGALLLEVPLSDMIRYKLWTQTWNTEFGSIDTPEGFEASLAVSPYHLLGEKKLLPPAMITAGDQDRVANVAHAYKLAAALQYAQAGDFVPLLHIDWGTGHGGRKTTEQRIDTWAYELAFLFRVLDMDVK